MRFQSFEELLHYWEKESPDRTALCWGQESCSFHELRERVLRRDAELEKYEKSCLGLLADGSMNCVVEIFAANIAGLQLVMLDASAPESILRGLIAYTDIDTRSRRRKREDSVLYLRNNGAGKGGCADG